MHRLLHQPNEQLTSQGVLVQQGGIIDASITPTSRKPQGKSTCTLADQPDTSLGKGGEAWCRQGSTPGEEERRLLQNYLADNFQGFMALADLPK